MDVFEPEKRSEIMRRVKSGDTKPEMRVRRILHAMGYRYRIHRKDLPGCPDIVLPRHQKIVMVHGCFWHGHDCPAGRKKPKTNTAYWIDKLTKNRLRDAANLAKLEAMGWHVLVIWECETRNHAVLANQLAKFMSEKVNCAARWNPTNAGEVPLGDCA